MSFPPSLSDMLLFFRSERVRRDPVEAGEEEADDKKVQIVANRKNMGWP